MTIIIVLHAIYLEPSEMIIIQAMEHALVQLHTMKMVLLFVLIAIILGLFIKNVNNILKSLACVGGDT